VVCERLQPRVSGVSLKQALVAVFELRVSFDQFIVAVSEKKR
jgi:hypothetical protein